MNIGQRLFACALSFFAVTIIAQAQQWQKIYDGAASGIAVLPSDAVVALVGGTTYRSTNAGADWTAGGIAPQNTTALRVGKTGTIFAGSTFGWSGLSSSTDGGQTWSSNSNISAWDVAFNSKGYIFVATEGLFVLRSVDNGLGWFGQNQGPPAWSIAVDAEDNIYTGTQMGGIYRSTDDGANWTGLPIDAPVVVDGLAIGPDGTIYMSGATGIGVPQGPPPLVGFYRSTDGGNTWKDISDRDSMQVSTRSVLTSSGTIYVAASNLGIRNARVLTSTDRGDHWEDLSSGMEWGFISGIAMDSHGRLYVASAKGVYSLEGTSAAPETLSPEENVLSVITGSDGSGSYIKADLNGSSRPQLQLIDMEGREVKNIPLEAFASGERRFNLADLNLSQGMYLCRYADGDRSQVVKVIVQ